MSANSSRNGNLQEDSNGRSKVRLLGFFYRQGSKQNKSSKTICRSAGTNLSTASPESSIIPLATGAEPAPPQGTTSPTFNKRLGCALPSCTPYLIPGSFGLLTICSTDQSTRARTPSHPYVQGPIKELLTYRIPTYAPFSKLCVRCVRTDCADPEPGMDAHDFGCIWARAPNRHVQFHCFFCFLKRY